MRVTNAMYTKNWLKNLERTTERMQRNEMMVSSGKSLLNLHDNPTGLSQSISIKEQITKQEEYLRAIDDGTAWLNTTEAALASVSDLLAEAQELAQVGANGPVSRNEIKDLAQHMDLIIDQMVDLANSKHADKYLFSGQQTKITPFERDGVSPDGVKYNGDTNSISREIHADSNIDINISGEEAFQTSKVFESLATLKKAFDSGDQKAIADAIAPIEEAFENAVSLRATVGYKMNRLQSVSEQHEMQKFHLESILGDIEGADIAETITNLKKEETAYQAALMVGSNMMQMSLLDFLR